MPQTPTQTKLLSELDSIAEKVVGQTVEVNARKRELIDAFHALIEAQNAARDIDAEIEANKEAADAIGVDRSIVTKMIEGRAAILLSMEEHSEVTVKEGRGRPTLAEKAIMDLFTTAEAIAAGVSPKQISEAAAKTEASAKTAPEVNAAEETEVFDRAEATSSKAPQTPTGDESTTERVAPSEAGTEAAETPEASDIEEEPGAAAVEETNDTPSPDEGFDESMGTAIEELPENTEGEIVDASVFDADDAFGGFDPDAEREYSEDATGPEIEAPAEGIDPADLDEIDRQFAEEMQVLDTAAVGPQTNAEASDDPVAAAAALAAAEIAEASPKETLSAYGSDNDPTI